MFDGFRRVGFMDALIAWNSLGKKVRCVYMQRLYEFDEGDWKTDFKVNGGQILDGEWFVEI